MQENIWFQIDQSNVCWSRILGKQLGKVTQLGLNQIVCIGSLVKDSLTHLNAAVFMNMYNLGNISNDHILLGAGLQMWKRFFEYIFTENNERYNIKEGFIYIV